MTTQLPLPSDLPVDDSQQLDAFMEDAAAGPWRPEPVLDGDGLQRRRPYIWLTNDQGDSLQVDEDTAAMLVNALRTLWDEPDLPADLEERLYAALLWWHKEGWGPAHADIDWPKTAEEEHRLAAHSMVAQMRGEVG